MTDKPALLRLPRGSWERHIVLLALRTLLPTLEGDDAQMCASLIVFIERGH